MGRLRHIGASCLGWRARRTRWRVVALRVNRRWGPDRIAYHLGLHPSTVGRVLARYRMPPLAHTDQATGVRLHRVAPVRYEKERPGELVHVDIKKQGRIPPSGGWRAHGHGTPEAKAAQAAGGGAGYRYLHHAIDDHSHLVYSQILDDERQDTATAFITRTPAHFASLGVTLEAVMTYNGVCYRCRAFNQVLTQAGVKHHYTHPYRPQTTLKGSTPADRVHNLPGNYT